VLFLVCVTTDKTKGLEDCVETNLSSVTHEAKRTEAMMKWSKRHDVAECGHGMKTQRIAFTKDPNRSLTEEKHPPLSAHIIERNEARIDGPLRFGGEHRVLGVLVLAMTCLSATQVTKYQSVCHALPAHRCHRHFTATPLILVREEETPVHVHVAIV